MFDNISDKIFFVWCKKNGYSIKQIMNEIPPHKKEQFSENIKKSWLKSLIGIEDYDSIVLVSIIIIIVMFIMILKT